MIAAGFEWLIFVDHPSWLIVSGFWISGTVIFFGGAFWGRLKFRMPERLVTSVETVALDFRYWLALLSVVYLYIATPLLLRQLKSILVEPTIVRGQTIVAPASPAVAVPTPTHVPRQTANVDDFGPIQPLDLEGRFMRSKQPCVLKLSAVPEQMNFRSIIAMIATRNSVCTIVDDAADQSPATRDIDLPPTPTPPAGLLIRWNKDTQPQGESVAQWFEGAGFIVNRGHILPPNSAATEIWIDIGPGSPWRNP
jgi:hypothetical protein